MVIYCQHLISHCVHMLWRLRGLLEYNTLDTRKVYILLSSIKELKLNGNNNALPCKQWKLLGIAF